MKKKYAYLVQIQYLGFRLHGWSKQPGLKTVHFFIDKTVTFILGNNNFKTIGASRTDAKVSANQNSFTLFLDLPLEEDDFLKALNINFPTDIRATKIEMVKSGFNALQPNKIKEYLYLFAFNQKPHPFCASLITVIQQNLNLALMKKGALLFKGKHDFCNYVTKPTPTTKTERTILECQIVKNTFYTASFFPTNSYALQISASGFMRNQVRLIMGQLIELGLGNIDLEDITEILTTKLSQPLKKIAPPSGLILQSVIQAE